MSRPSSAPVALGALALGFATVSCSEQGPSTPTEKINTSYLAETLGTAAAIPLQECRDEWAQPLLMATGAGRLHAGQTILRVSGNRYHLSCMAPYAKQDNAVPLTAISAAVSF